MDRKQYEVVNITNVSDYDFPSIDVKAMNAAIRSPRAAGSDQTERVHNKPSVPTLMWDGDTYELKAGETKEFPRFLGEKFAKHIVDRAIIDKVNVEGVKNNVGTKGIRNEALRKSILERVLVARTLPEAVEATKEEELDEVPAHIVPKPEEAPEVPQSDLEKLNRAQLMKIAAEAGIEVKNTMKKVDLIKALNAA